MTARKEVSLEMEILIDTIGAVKEFADIVYKYDAEIYLQSGRYIIDAKSIIGIFSLNLLKPLTLFIDNCNEEQYESLCKDIEKFKVR